MTADLFASLEPAPAPEAVVSGPVGVLRRESPGSGRLVTDLRPGVRTVSLQDRLAMIQEFYLAEWAGYIEKLSQRVACMPARHDRVEALANIRNRPDGVLVAPRVEARVREIWAARAAEQKVAA